MSKLEADIRVIVDHVSKISQLRGRQLAQCIPEIQRLERCERYWRKAQDLHPNLMIEIAIHEAETVNGQV